MPLHLGQRLHAWYHRIGHSSDEREVAKLYHEVEELFRSHSLLFDEGRAVLVRVIAKEAAESLHLTEDHPQYAHIAFFIGAHFNYEELFVLPTISEQPTISECWKLKDELSRQKKLFDDFDHTCEAIRIYTCTVFDTLFQACPSLLQEQDEGISVPTTLIHLIGNLGKVVHKLCEYPFTSDMVELGLSSTLRSTLEHHLMVASGANPTSPTSFTRAPKYATQSDLKKDALVRTYIGGTPLEPLFHQEVNFTIPNHIRFEHLHMIAGSGHGKTQTLQYMIGHDLEAVKEGRQSIIVLDSQGDLINTIANLAVFAPDDLLHDRLVHIDPTDIEYPVSLNLFDVGQDRLSGYAPLEKERLTNSILELYDFVLGSLLDAGMTQKQSVIFRYVTRLMLHIPNATIHTLRELMEPNAEHTFAPYIAKLSGTAKHFFLNEFATKEFEQTKKQVLRRLYGILENQTFERMFSHPKSKLDLFHEMNSGKVILINTAKDLLKESGTEIFGRFFIALIAQAAQERATIKEKSRVPTMVYIDEAGDYFDRNISTILSQARKYKVGMTLSHQYLGQLPPALQEAFAANTAIKMAGGVSPKDARVMATSVYCEPNLIEGQKKLSFACNVRGITPQAVPLQFPAGYMESLPRILPSDRHAVREKMRKDYAVYYRELEGDEAKHDSKEPTEPKIGSDGLPEPTKGW